MEGNRFRTLAIAAAYGNAALHPSTVEFAGAGATANMAELPSGALLTGLKLVHDDLTANTTLSVGVTYPDGGGTDSATSILAGAASTSAGVREYAGHPIKFDSRAIITVTAAGAGDPTGKVTVVPEYIFLGTN